MSLIFIANKENYILLAEEPTQIIKVNWAEQITPVFSKSSNHVTYAKL